MGRRYFAMTMFLTLCVAGYLALPKKLPDGAAGSESGADSSRSSAPAAGGARPSDRIARQRAGLGRVVAELHLVAGRIEDQIEDFGRPLASPAAAAERRRTRSIRRWQKEWDDELGAVLSGLPRRPGPADPAAWKLAWNEAAAAGDALRSLARQDPRAPWQTRLSVAREALDRAHQSYRALDRTAPGSGGGSGAEGLTSR